MSHDQLGRMLSLVDTLGRKHQRSFAVPVGGAWSGPSLDAASADATASTTSLSGALRSGDYQIGVNAHDIEGFPAQISVYRDATFALGYTSYFDNGGRLTYRADRTSRAIDSAVVTTSREAGGFAQELLQYDTRTSAPLMSVVEAPRGGSSEPSLFTRDVELEMATAGGSGPGLERPAAYTYTRDTAGRVTQMTARLVASGNSLTAPVTALTYRPDGRLAQKTNADGVHDFTYDARGLVATQTVVDEGVYAYGYDELGRNTTLTFPDGHVRRQIFDDLGRTTSRCYEYPGDPVLDRCYGAQYDAVGNPVRLTSPEGADVMEYDALDRLTKVTREVGGAPSAIETYDFNALGALKLNAGAVLDHQRPRLAGGGSADAAVPATLNAQPVVLDGGGRVTSLRGVSFTWSFRGYPLTATPPVPALPETYTVDAFLRRVSKAQGASTEYYVYDGADRVGVVAPDGIDPVTSAAIPGSVLESYLFDGIDHPLRMKRGADIAYFELDLAGNVRRLRGLNGTDLGGYRYSAFGKTVDDDATVVQPLRWKARWWQSLGATEIYDVRARQWSPELGSFLSVDQFVFHDSRTTLWGWPGQNPTKYRDPSGRWGENDPRADAWGDYAVTHLDEPGVQALGLAGLIAYGSLAIASVQAIFTPVQAATVGGTGGSAAKSVLDKAQSQAPSCSTAAGGAPNSVPGITDKIARQMGPRGWTPKQMEEAIASGQRVPAINRATGNAAIRYVHPETGQSVVVDTARNEVIHVGGPGFQYGPGSGDL